MSWSRWLWLIAFVSMAATALALTWFPTFGSQVVLYSTTDYARLPTTSAVPQNPQSCASIQRENETPKLVDQACGTPASTYRVLARVSDEAQCVHDADLTYSSSAGVVCLDYDWAANQCLQITNDSVSKVGCAEPGAVRPDMAVIGAVDVSYCREGGIAHSVRHFTICTLAGNKDCKGRTNGK